MDETFVETAENIQQSEIEKGIAKARANVPKAKVSEDYDGLCVYCSTEVPQGRVALGYTYCTKCSEKLSRGETPLYK